MRRSRAHRTHFPEFDGHAALRALPCRFRSGEAGAYHAYCCRHCELRSWALTGHSRQRVAVEADGLPFIQKSRAQALVKIDCRSVPVEHLPAHAKTIFFTRDRRNMRQQSFSDSLPSIQLADVDIFQKQSGATFEGRVIIEEERISGGLFVPLRHQRPKLGRVAESITQQVRFGHHRRETLEFSQFTNQQVQCRHIAGNSRTN